MATARTHFILPVSTLKALDSVAGPRGRSAFVAEVLDAELKRRKLREFLSSDKVIFRDEDYPDLKRLGAAGWVREMRRKSEAAERRGPARNRRGK
jgi:hypothetical protein